MAHFVIVEGASRRTIDSSSVTIGRQFTANVVLRSAEVSRVHALVFRRGDRFVIRDAGSTNGTYVDGRRVVERALESGDRIILGKPEAEVEHPGLMAGRQLEVRIRGETCTLELVAAAADLPSELEDEVTVEIPRYVEPSAVSPSSVQESETTLDPDALIVSAPVRGKARIKASRWVPTSDIAPRPVRQWASLLLTLATLVGGAALLWTENAEMLTPGGLTAAHQSDAFREQTGWTGTTCAACHVTWAGVSDGDCLACHPVLTPGPHGDLELACAGCHQEHRVRAAREDLVPRHRCTDCHTDAHEERVGQLSERNRTDFLNRVFSAPRIHAGHRSIACRDCHATEDDQKTGRVTTGCAACHGGATGLSDARCLTCHPYHEAEEEQESGDDSSPGGLVSPG